MNTRLTWHLEIIDWDAINKKKYGGIVFLNTYIENFFTLQDVWDYLGFKLKKQRFGYSGLKNNKEYRLTRM
jgi:hypothetical protein